MDVHSVQLPLLRTFNREQIDFICEALYSWKDGQRLVALFRSDPTVLHCYDSSPSVLRAYLLALHHNCNHEELFRVMAENRFDPKYHAEMIDLWYEARYAEDQLRKRKPLGPVEKYRIRKKFPPPSSVWDGDEVIYSFKECARRILKAFYEQNKYPSAEEKREIARLTRLKMVQIANWFKNRRQRDKTVARHNSPGDYSVRTE